MDLLFSILFSPAWQERRLEEAIKNMTAGGRCCPKLHFHELGMNEALKQNEEDRDRDRKLRAHKKSREGCGNCKLRRVKCDETKPRCKRCGTYGVLCDYGCKGSRLQLAVAGSCNVETVLEAGTLIPKPRLTRSLECDTAYQIGNEDIVLLRRFQARTLQSLSTNRSLRKNKFSILKLMCSNPFLMHTAITLSLTHDRYESSPPSTSMSTTEAFHWHRSVTLFNRKLSGTVRPSERDAIWATAIILGTIVFSDIEANTPEDAWPLKPPSSLDLSWFGISSGRDQIWNLAQPLRADSVNRPIVLEHMNFEPLASASPCLATLPSGLIELCGIDATSTAINNPYLGAVSTLARSLDSDSEYSVIMNFISFSGYMQLDYKRLLERKDPCALLILAHWYARVCRYQSWWIRRRAFLECQAICIYLDRYHQSEIHVQRLLEFPRLACSAVARCADPCSGNRT